MPSPDITGRAPSDADAGASPGSSAGGTDGVLQATDGRSWRRRRASRVVVTHRGRTLLFRDTDPGVPGSLWYMTPGGGLDEGETWVEAAVRELREETGWRVPASEVVGPIAHRTVVHGYSDRVTEQEEMFFRVEVDAAQVSQGLDTSGHTDNERRRITGHGWYSPAELVGLPVWPAQLAQLVDADPDAGVRELDDAEESTVPAVGRPRP